MVDHDDSCGTYTNNGILEELEEEILIVVYRMMVAASDSHNLFNANGLEVEWTIYNNHNVRVIYGHPHPHAQCAILV